MKKIYPLLLTIFLAASCSNHDKAPELSCTEENKTLKDSIRILNSKVTHLNNIAEITAKHENKHTRWDSLKILDLENKVSELQERLTYKDSMLNVFISLTGEWREGFFEAQTGEIKEMLERFKTEDELLKLQYPAAFEKLEH